MKSYVVTYSYPVIEEDELVVEAENEEAARQAASEELAHLADVEIDSVVEAD